MPLLQWTKGETALFHNVYLGTSANLMAADLKTSRSPVTMYYHAPGLQPGATYYWRVDEIEKDGTTIHTGDVWSFTTQALTAYHPDPADGANTASPTPTLAWMAGVGAVKHHLYFGSSLDAVSQGTATVDKGLLAAADTLFKPEILESLTTYYWRVDEILIGDAVKTGPVWSFRTVLPVDDFESYTDDLAAKTTIFDTWIDGLTNGLSGSIVGNDPAPFAEQLIVHGGRQSMPLEYNNVAAPFYSEAYREFTNAQDWTANGINTLVLYVRGLPRNPATPLYVALEDASKRVGVAIHPDPAVTTLVKWTEWKVPLSEFTATGVNLAKIKKISIGAGDKANPKAGGKGMLYIDDLGVTK
jgi:hypothetical protein